VSGQIIAILAKVTSKIWFSKGTIPKCPRNSGYLRITVICPRICLLPTHLLSIFFESSIWIHHSTQPPAPSAAVLPQRHVTTPTNPLAGFSRSPSIPILTGSKECWKMSCHWNYQWVLGGASWEDSGSLVLLMEHGKFWGCVQPWQRIYMAFFHEHFKGTSQYHLHTKRYGLIKGLLTTIMPQYGPSKALFPGWGTALGGGALKFP